MVSDPTQHVRKPGAGVQSIQLEQFGASFAEVARRHEVSRGLLWNWRRQVRRGELVPESMPAFVPVHIMPEAPIALPDGTCVRVGSDIGLVALRRVMAAVRR